MATALTLAQLQALTADPAPPPLTANQKTPVRAALEATTGLAGDNLSAAESNAFRFQLKTHLSGLNAGAPLRLGVEAALAGSILSNLPEKLPMWLQRHINDEYIFKTAQER